MTIRMPTHYPPGPRDGLCGITFYGPLHAHPLAFAARVAQDYGDFEMVVDWRLPASGHGEFHAGVELGNADVLV